jgi:2-amino-4-hydroxy-6-hydroxymethyldihydropteridine diphosphokinase
MADGVWRRAILGLGGNIGHPRSAMQQALQALDARDDIRVIAVSSLYRTPPWGLTDQPDFLNACALIETRIGPDALLKAALESEKALKRVRAERWGPRTIDIDIIDYDGLSQATPGLQLPHPRAHERAFVLLPMSEVAPAIELGGKTVERWLRGCNVSGVEKASEDGSWWRAT